VGLGRASNQVRRTRRVEGAVSVGHGLLATGQAAGDGGHPLAADAGPHDLAAAQDKGVRGVQVGRRGLALRIRYLV